MKELIKRGEISTEVNTEEVARDISRVTCYDCGGWPIKGGAIFIPVVVQTKDSREGGPYVLSGGPGKASTGFVCELCFIRRLERRARIVTGTSSPPFQVRRDVMNELSRVHRKIHKAHRPIGRKHG